MRCRLALLTLVFALARPSAAEAFTLSDFEAPDSVVVDPKDGSLYVSNVRGAPDGRDGNGYVSRVGASGNLVIQKYLAAEGGMPLHAPKGMALVGSWLYVADLDALKAFDVRTRRPAALVDLSRMGAIFLNDIAVDGHGVLYVSDTIANRIFTVEPARNHQASVFRQGRQLGRPSGLVFNPKSRQLMAASWESGCLLEIGRDGREHVVKRGLTRPEGLDYDAEGNLYVSDFEKGEVYRIPRLGRGALSAVMTGLTAPADVSVDRSRGQLAVTSPKGGSVTVTPLSKLPASAPEA